MALNQNVQQQDTAEQYKCCFFCNARYGIMGMSGYGAYLAASAVYFWFFSNAGRETWTTNNMFTNYLNVALAAINVLGTIIGFYGACKKSHSALLWFQVFCVYQVLYTLINDVLFRGEYDYFDLIQIIWLYFAYIVHKYRALLKQGPVQSNGDALIQNNEEKETEVNVQGNAANVSNQVSNYGSATPGSPFAYNQAIQQPNVRYIVATPGMNNMNYMLVPNPAAGPNAFMPPMPAQPAFMQQPPPQPIEPVQAAPPQQPQPDQNAQNPTAYI